MLHELGVKKFKTQQKWHGNIFLKFKVENSVGGASRGGWVVSSPKLNYNSNLTGNELNLH